MRNRSERIRLLVILGVTLALAQGCATSDSGNIATVEIHPDYTVTGNSASSVECSATFRVGGSLGTQLNLTSGDVATCSDGTTTVTMVRESDIFGGVSYKATGLAYGTDRTYSMTFARPQKTGESFTSTVTLPAGVVISNPPSGGSVSKGGAPLAWSGSGSGSVDIFITHPAGSFSVNSKSDTGTADLNSTDLASATAGSGTIRVTRSKVGTQSAGLNGRGSIRATQYGEQNVVFAP